MKPTSRFIGCVVQIRLNVGFVYGVCTHDLEEMGQILKLYAPIYESKKDSDFFESKNVPIRTSTHFPLKYVLRDPDIDIVGIKKLSDLEAETPKFRSLGITGINQEEEGWWISEGSKKYWVRELTPEMATYSMSGFPSLSTIEEWYSKDEYPWSKANLTIGPLSFDPDLLN